MMNKKLFVLTLLLLTTLTPVLADNHNFSAVPEEVRERVLGIEIPQPTTPEIVRDVQTGQELIRNNQVEIRYDDSTRTPTVLVANSRMISIEGLGGERSVVRQQTYLPVTRFLVYRHPDTRITEEVVRSQGVVIGRVTSDEEGYVEYTLEQGFSTTLLDAVGYWAFDESSGAVADDSAGINDWDTTNYDVGVDGKLGLAINTTLDSQNPAPDGVGFSTGTVFGDGGTNSWTIGGWFMHPDTTTRYLFSNFGENYGGYFIRLESNLANTKGRYRLSFGGGNQIDVTDNSRNNIGEWVHVVLRKSGTNFWLYYNGVQIGSQSGVTLSDPGELTVFCGFAGTCSDTPGLGTDEIFFYDRTLTVSEIEELYNAGVGFNPYAQGVIEITAVDSINHNNLLDFSTTTFDGTTTITNTTTTGSVIVNVENLDTPYNVTLCSDGYGCNVLSDANVSSSSLVFNLTHLQPVIVQNFTNPFNMSTDAERTFVLSDYYSYIYDVCVIVTDETLENDVLLGEACSGDLTVDTNYFTVEYLQNDSFTITSKGEERIFTVGLSFTDFYRTEQTNTSFVVNIDPDVVNLQGWNFSLWEKDDKITFALFVIVLIGIGVLAVLLPKTIFPVLGMFFYLFAGVALYFMGINLLISIAVIIVGLAMLGLME